MLRSVTLSVALAVLAAACALVEPPAPPPPAGTVPLQVQVQNMRREPAKLTVRTPEGDLAGAVQPATVPADSTIDVTIYAPPGTWSFRINGSSFDILGNDLPGVIRNGCSPLIGLEADGEYSVGCK
jgi:hypothetical protein